MHEWRNDRKDAFSTLSSFQSDPERLGVINLIRGLYLGFLNREPDSAGLLYWSAEMESGADIQTVLQGILNSDEYITKTCAIHNVETLKQAVARYARSFLASSPITIVDIGAQQLPDEDHVYAAMGQYDVPKNIVGFEPLEKLNAVNGAHKSSEDTQLLATFVGDGELHTFHINKPESTSSLLPFNELVTHELVGLSALATKTTELVQTQRLDESLVNYSYIDFLKLDIQGFELPALLNSTQVLERTQVVHCEVSFLEIYRGQALFSEIEIFLREMGFSFIDFSFSCRYPYHNSSNRVAHDRLGWADAIFFRESASSLSERELFVQSLIALLIYGKHSLAAALANRCNAEFSRLFDAPPAYDVAK